MKNLTLLGQFRDGGTEIYIDMETVLDPDSTESINKAKHYYLNNRIGSKNKGELFDYYPITADSMPLDKSQFNLIKK